MSEQAREALRLRGIKERVDTQLRAVESGLAPVVANWVTAQIAATVLGTTPQNANNMLARLLRCGLVERRRTTVESGGTAYEYRMTGEWL